MGRFKASEVEEILGSDEVQWQEKTYRTKDWVDAEDSFLSGDGWNEIGGHRFLVNGEWYETEILEQGGGMDEGSNAYVVFKFGDQLFRKSGYYASHYGYDWDGDFEEVEAYEKTIQDYRPV